MRFSTKNDASYSAPFAFASSCQSEDKRIYNCVVHIDLVQLIRFKTDVWIGKSTCVIRLAPPEEKDLKIELILRYRYCLYLSPPVG